MSLNKKLLVSAIAGLLISGNASAVVLGVDPPRQYARELVKPVALTDANDDIEFNLGYNFSGGEVRYGRLECTGNIQIGSPTITETSTTFRWVRSTVPVRTRCSSRLRPPIRSAVRPKLSC